jgi:nitrous oxide reductase accessory protein NosL
LKVEENHKPKPEIMMSQLNSISAALHQHLIIAPESAKSMIDIFVSLMNATEWTHDDLVSVLMNSLGISDKIDEIIADVIWEKCL